MKILCTGDGGLRSIGGVVSGPRGPEAGCGRDGFKLGLPDTRSEGTGQSGEAPPADHRVQDPEAARGAAGER